MAGVDIFCLIALAIAALLGFRRGFAAQLSFLVVLLLGLWLALRYAVWTADLLNAAVGLPPHDALYVAIACNGLLALVAALFLSRLLRSLVRSLHLGNLDSLLGALLSLFTAALILSFALLISPGGRVSHSPSPDAEPSFLRRGPIARTLVRVAPAVYPTLRLYSDRGFQLMREELDNLPHDEQ